MGVVRIEVDVDGTQEAANDIGQLNSEIKALPGTAQEAKSEWQKLVDSVKQSQTATQGATQATQEMGASVGELAVKGGALTKVLGVLASPAGMAGIALLTGVIISKFASWKEETERNREEMDKFTASVIKQREELAKLWRQYELVGLTGTARSEEIARRDMELAKLRMDQLQGLLGSVGAGGRREAIISLTSRTRLSESQLPEQWIEEEIAKRTEGIKKQFTTAENEYWKAEARLQEVVKQGVWDRREAEKKEEEKAAKERADALKKDYNQRLRDQQKYDEQWLAQQVEVSERMLKTEIDMAHARVKLQEDVAKNIAALNQRNFEQFDRDFQKWQEGRAQAVESLTAGNRSMALGMAKGAKNYGGVLGLELAQLDELKAKYADNAEAIAAIEERKKLVIQQVNGDIAKDSEDKFQRAASAIEGFFNRVFMSARSFGDVFRQLWMQIANYAISQIAKMVAAWWTGQKSMSQAVATGGFGGGGGGGISQGVQSVMQFASRGAPMAAGGLGTSWWTPGAGVAGDVFNGSGPLESLGNTGSGALTSASLFGNVNWAKVGAGGAAMLGMGLMNAGTNNGSLAMGGIGGALMGGGIGYMAAPMLSQAFGLGAGATILGVSSTLAFTGIGALAGLGLGIYMAARRRGQQKRASAQVHEQYNSAQAEILRLFEEHRASYDTSVSSLTMAYQQAVSALQGMGGPGRNTIGEIYSPYLQTLQRMKNIQLAREGRSSTISGLPIPEFGAGSNGIIRTGSGGFIAGLHNNEAVLNERAAAALGDKNIKALNSGNFSAVGAKWEIHIHATDAQSVARLFKDNGDALVGALRRACLDKALPSPV